MTTHRLPAKGTLKASLDRVPASEVTQPDTPKAKKGLEVVKEKFQAHEDLPEEARVVVWDHDANQVLFSGTPVQYRRLTKAISTDKEG